MRSPGSTLTRPEGAVERGGRAVGGIDEALVEEPVEPVPATAQAQLAPLSLGDTDVLEEAGLARAGAMDGQDVVVLPWWLTYSRHAVLPCGSPAPSPRLLIKTATAIPV
jgi:hypothetical protein